MSIVLNERDWAEEMISSRQLGKHPIETLTRVAKYYRQCEGYSRQGVRDKLDDFLIQCDPGVILVKWSDTLDWISKIAGQKSIIEVDEVCITEAELKVVNSMESVRARRLAFTMLCIAKYWNIVQPRNNNWVNTPDSQVMSMANICVTTKVFNLMLHEMKNDGLVSFGKRVDNLNIKVKYIYPDSPVALRITDFRSLGNQYMLYCGAPFFHCAHCGLTVKRKNNAQKYCNDCAAEIHVRQSVNSVMRNRTELA